MVYIGFLLLSVSERNINYDIINRDDNTYNPYGYSIKILCLRSRDAQPHLIRILRSVLIQSMCEEISKPITCAMSFRDLASASLRRRAARTFSWVMILTRSSLPYSQINNGHWIK